MKTLKIEVGYGPDTYGTLELKGSKILAKGDIDQLKKFMYVFGPGLDSREIMNRLVTDLKGYCWSKVVDDET
jgi:hypothetical protein